MEENSKYGKPAPAPVETERIRNRKVYVPRVDIVETGEAIVLYADLPGVDDKSVEVTLEKNVLTIGATAAAQDFPGHSLSYAEYDTGDYERAFTISEEVDRDRIEAVVKNGVLKLVLPKAPQAAARKITVRSQ
jgi:HSP20 family molecular chaperone IbpA